MNLGIIATAAKILIESGVTGDALISAIDKLEKAQNSVPSAGSIRQKRYRERNVLRNEQRNLADNIDKNQDINLSNIERNVTSLVTVDDPVHIGTRACPDDSLAKEVVSKKERKKGSKDTGSRFSLEAPFPDSWKNFCLEKRPELNPEETFESFRDWWVAQAGPKARKLNWDATWRTWVRRQEKPRNNGHGPPMSFADQNRLKNEKVLEEMERKYANTN